MDDVYAHNASAQGIVIEYGHYSELVNSKHEKAYGPEGAASTRNAATRILSDAMRQTKDASQSNNVLLVGKVQSGKTSNLEMLSALAFDNGFRILVLFGGYTANLLDQSVKRFRKTFDIPDYDEDFDLEDSDAPVLMSTAANSEISLDISGCNEDYLRHVLESGNPIIIACLKHYDRIRQVAEKLALLRGVEGRAFIIDDEGDQASLNNARDKATDASSTYRSICTLKDVLHDPLYFSVTATPQANVFLNELSQLIPSRLHLLSPAKGYCGAEVYHLSDPGAVITSDDDFEACLENNTSPESFQTAMRHFLVASAILTTRRDVKRRNKSDMVIHARKEIKYHEQISQWAEAYLNDLKGVLSDAIDGDDDAAVALFKPVYLKYFDEDTREAVPFDRDFIKKLYKVADSSVVLRQNSREKSTNSNSIIYQHRINIGADLLQRGITFDHLLTTYFVRWAKSGGNMDTNLQRARWFGYRSQYVELTRLFTTEEIAQEFSYLGDMEDDLWTQMEEVENGTREIGAIRILAERTKQQPTRKSVVSYSIIRVDDWTKQSNGLFDEDKARRNRNAIEDFVMRHSFVDVDYGRQLTSEPTALMSMVDVCDVLKLIRSLDEAIFDGDGGSFTKSELLQRIRTAKSVAVLQMSMGQERSRSFYKDSHRIKALQQGRSSTSVEESKYLGDKTVINPNADISIQIHRIVPKIDEVYYQEYEQYLLAIYDSRKSPRAYVKV